MIGPVGYTLEAVGVVQRYQIYDPQNQNLYHAKNNRSQVAQDERRTLSPFAGCW